jgi:hypothetical protein
MKVTLSIIGFFLALIALGWVLMANNLAMTSVFAPAQEQVRRNTFEQSKAYNDGMIKELEAMQFEYIQAEPEHQAALRSLILSRAAGFPNDNLPPDLKNFLNELKAQ